MKPPKTGTKLVAACAEDLCRLTRRRPQILKEVLEHDLDNQFICFECKQDYEDSVFE